MEPFYVLHLSGNLDFEEREIQPQTNLVEGIAREQRTYIKNTNQKVINDYSLLSINHDVRKEQFGITTVHFNGEPKTIEFNDYLIPEKFNAYHSDSRNIVIFQANGRTTKSALHALKGFTDFEIKKVKFNFNIADSLIDEYKSAWFKDINTNVSAMSMTGQHVQEDEYFENLMQQGELSNITIPFEFRGSLHPVMITKDSGVILYKNYPNYEIELNLVNNVFDDLIRKVWDLDPEVDV